MTADRPETVQEFVEDRAQFLGIDVFKCPTHGGWQIGLVLDGHYSTFDDANDIAVWFRERLQKALDAARIEHTLRALP